MLDLSKLTPAPWEVVTDASGGHYIPHHDHFPMLLPECEVDADLAALEFAALARNAFDGDPEALAWWEANRRHRDEAK